MAELWKGVGIVGVVICLYFAIGVSGWCVSHWRKTPSFIQAGCVVCWGALCFLILIGILYSSCIFINKVWKRVNEPCATITYGSFTAPEENFIHYHYSL